MTVHRPPARPSAPQGNQCSISHFLASLGAQENWYLDTYCTSMLLSIDSRQNRVSADKSGVIGSCRWPVSPDSIVGSGVDPSCLSIFEVIRWQVTSFKMITGSRLIFLKFIWNMLCLCATKFKFWFQTDLRYENWASYYRQGRQLLFLFSPIFMLWLVKISKVSSCGKIMQHLETCVLWQLKLTEFCVNL